MKLLIFISIFIQMTLLFAQEESPALKQKASVNLVEQAKQTANLVKDTVEETVRELVNGFNLKGGATAAHYSIRSQSHTQSSTNTGFNSHLSFRYLPFELNISSYVFFGKMRDYSLFGDTSRFQFFANNREIETSGQIRQVMFSPNIKYIFDRSFYNSWHPYFGLGPSWSLTTFHLKPYTDGSGINRENHRISFLNFGGILFFGMEEIFSKKESHPVFVEILYSFAQTNRLYLVDASNKAEVKEVSVEDTYFNVLGHTVMFNVGMTLF